MWRMSTHPITFYYQSPIIDAMVERYGSRFELLSEETRLVITALLNERLLELAQDYDEVTEFEDYLGTGNWDIDLTDEAFVLERLNDLSSTLFDATNIRNLMIGILDSIDFSMVNA